MATRAQVNPFFSPTQISGCALWFDAADSSTALPANPSNGASIRGWRDKINNVTLSNQNASPTWTTSGVLFTNPSNVISGSTQNLIYVGSTPITLTQNYTMFVAHAPNAFDILRVAFTILAPNAFNVNPTFAAWVQPSVNEGNTIGVYDGSSGWRTLTQWNYINTGAGNRRIDTLLASSVNVSRTNGTPSSSLATDIGSGTVISGSQNLTGIGMSASSTFQGNRAYDGRIFEVLLYTSTLPLGSVQLIEGYLAWKWGLQANLAADHPYKSSPIPPLLSPPTTLPLLTESWNPRQIPGCCIWFDCADSSTLNISNNIVSTWRSKGSEPLLATSVGGGSILYSNFNNLPALYFNGTNTRMTTNTISSYGTTGTTWLTVSVNLTPVTGSTPVDASVTFATLSGTSPEKSIRYNFVPQFVIYTFNNGQIRGGRTNNDNGVRGFIDGPTSMNAYANGTDFTESILSATFQPGVNQAFQLGQWNTGWLLGFIQEIIVYNSALNLAQYQLVEGYLAWKWGFQRSLTANHPYRNTPPITASIQYPLRSVLTIASWLPTRITGCQLWLDGADPNGNNVIPAVGTSISTWVDKSGAGANGTVVGTAAQYASGRGLLFSQSGAYNSSYSASLTNESLFIVFRYANPNTQQGLVAQTGDGGRTITITSGTSTAAFESSVYNVAFGAVSPSTTVPQNTIGIGVLVTRNSNMAIFYNGTSFGTPTTVTITSGRTSVIGGAYNGGVPNSAQYFGGTLFEIVGFNVALNTSQRQQVEGYLAWKWGLQANLPSTHPFARWPPSP